MGLLDKINSPNDIKDLSYAELECVASEIREFLIQNIAKTGGHLASNLGIVELTLALHKVFDTSRDRLIFDVGHQSYVHKILTGRKVGFENLRKFKGLSGFCRPSESVHDACISGHASNSVSISLGMARARTLCGQDYSVVSVIGDGALTGGMAYEALSDAGQSKEPMIVILNDNEMSIAKNVGAMTNYLAKLRLKRKYLHFKDVYRRIIKKSKVGICIDNGLHGIKKALKNMFIPSLFFEDMGFTYLGPANGHDIKYMVYLFELARDLKRPVVIHVTTTKGKGYKHSESKPEVYHGVGKFNVDAGVQLNSNQTFSSVFGSKMLGYAEQNPSICAITAAMTSGVGLSGFAEKYPERFFDVAIAEEHAVAMAAGLSAQGMLPVCAIYSTFLQRAYDMLIHDVAISNQHIIFAVDRAGLVGEDGETHHGVFDVSYLSMIPGMTLFAPSNFAELRSMLDVAINKAGPVALRYPRGAEGIFTDDTFSEKSSSVLLKEGKDVTLLSYGILINNVIDACEKAEKLGISCEIIKINVISPIDATEVLQSVQKTGKLIVVEDVVHHGSVCERISSLTAFNGINCRIKALNSGDSFTTHGELKELYKALGIDADGILKAILEVCDN